MPDPQNPTYTDVIEQEDRLLRRRRRLIMGEAFADQLDDNRFGIALSGGGIRSATINLGFLKTLSRFGLLKQTDYLSSVSGGGYTNAYVQATLKKEGSYDCLFQDEHIEYMRERGEYLFPGSGWRRVWNQLTLVVAFLVSLVMSLVSFAIVMGLVAILGYFIGGVFGFNDTEKDIFWRYVGEIFKYGGIGLLAIIVIHYLINIAYLYNLYVSSKINRIEAGVLLTGLGAIVIAFFMSFRDVTEPDWNAVFQALGLGGVFFLLGFLTNPNAVSFHRFYRKQLADAFLHFAQGFKNMPLQHLHLPTSEAPNDYLAPYPLINTTLNLQSSKDPNFQGAKASDYFLLSPRFCGAKLVDYAPTADTIGYQAMTLPAAITISAAAVNPGLGAYSNKLYSIALTLLNLRLGFWVRNPKKLPPRFPFVWWPSYFFYELLGRIGTDKQMINISDGGHIENLAVMELLRRKCKLIVAIDAGADPNFIFGDLENLTIRARNELGIDIRFRKDQIPEDVIRPKPSHGYSVRRFAVADLYQLWDKKEGENGEEVIEHYQDRKVGLFVYVKSSVTAPQGRPDISRDEFLRYGTYKYKIYHPEFPHESTADQFFDPIQWESYYQLGQFLGADLLGLEGLDTFTNDNAPLINLDQFIEHIDRDKPLFPTQEAAAAPAVSARGLDDREVDYEEQRSVGKEVEYKM